MTQRMCWPSDTQGQYLKKFQGLPPIPSPAPPLETEVTPINPLLSRAVHRGIMEGMGSPPEETEDTPVLL